ncbi:hypothetical protein HYY72_00195 [Candidatus Woesearchaeota archaeon]|nr:hypothetical protein [Candidatus Woesearchaeota archaeon]
MFLNKRVFWSCFIVAFTLLVAGFIRSGVEPLSSMAVANPGPDMAVSEKTGITALAVISATALAVTAAILLARFKKKTMEET